MGFDMGKDVFVVGFDTNRKIFRSQDQRLALVQTFRRLPTDVDMEACLAVGRTDCCPRAPPGDATLPALRAMADLTWSPARTERG